MKNIENDLQGKKILFIAYFFPPVNSTEVPGAMRTVKFLRNLHEFKYHVLTTDARVDQANSALSHVNIPINNEIIHRVKVWDLFTILLSVRSKIKNLFWKNASVDQESGSGNSVFQSIDQQEAEFKSKFQTFKDGVHNLLYYPDQAGPWILPAFFYGRKLVKKEKIDIIFATGSPWSSLVIGYLISKVTKTPLILDFRDPWINNPFHVSKGKTLDRWSARLEKSLVRSAAAVSLNTEALLDDFSSRFPEIDRNKFFVLHNGFDEADFTDLKDVKANDTEDTITLCHTGFLYGVRDPSVLLDAILEANQNLNPEIGHRHFRFVQIGNVQLNYDLKDRYDEMIRNGSLVLKPATSYKECLKELMKADYLVNIQPATKTQIPSKLYDYLGLNRRILNITPKDGALGTLVKKYGLGEIFSLDEHEELLEKLLEAGKSNLTDEFPGYEHKDIFNCKYVTDQLKHRISELLD